MLWRIVPNGMGKGITILFAEKLDMDKKVHSISKKREQV